MQAFQRGIVAIDQEEAFAVTASSEPHAISPRKLLAKLDDRVLPVKVRNSV
jgi:hypothetical protein